MHLMGKVSSKNFQVITAFIFGVIFVSVILYLVFNSDSLDANRMWVVRVVMSLAAAGVAAILPGFIDIEGKVPWLNITLVRAGGALAVFCLVFLYPLKEHVPDPIDPLPLTSSKAKAENWMYLVSNKKYQKAYMELSSLVKEQYPESQFIELINPIMTALGTLREKIQINTTSFISPPGHETGRYAQHLFKTKYSDYPEHVYFEITLIGDRSAKDWRVYGFRFGKKNDAGAYVPLEL